MKVDRNNLNRKIFALKDFRGVDYASSPLEVKPYRATDMANLLLRDGMLHKRNGIRQFYIDHPPVDDGRTFEEQYEVKVFSSARRGTQYIVVQYLDKINDTGSAFYTFRMDAYGNLSIATRQHCTAAKELGQSVYVNDKLYVFCGGEYLIFADGAYERLSEGNCYIPTTTINIPLRLAVGADGSTETDTFVEFPNESNESINMLTEMRRNRFIVKQSFEYESGQYFSYNKFFYLDGKTVFPTDDDFTDVIDKSWYSYRWPKIIGKNNVSYSFTVKHSSEIFAEGSGGLDRNVWFCEDVGCILYEQYFGLNISTWENIPHVLAVVNESKFKQFLSGLSSTEYGYVEFELQYYEKNSTDNAKYIKSATCAMLFGVDGANDRIFVGGGMNPNIVYFSENDEDYKPNPTYFPVDNFLICGMNASPITGFMRVSNGTLAIFKNVEAYGDVAVYYTSGFYTDVGTGEEGNTYKQARFTITAGDITRKGISAKAITNFEGDNLFVGKEGVFGIQLSSNVASGERYARERSRTINPKIAKLGLENAKAIVYEDKYFLAVNNGEVYVADARYKFTMKGDQENTFNYEWFRLTGLFVNEWFLFEDKLWFIDKDGYFCSFVEAYADQYMVSTFGGELTVGADIVTFNAERLQLIKASSYAVDQQGNTWQLQLTEDETAIIIPEDIDTTEGADLSLWFHIPIPAYWQSAVLNLENPMYRKNMWALSVTASAEHGGMLNLGYKTRLNAVNNIEIEGVNARDEEDMNLIGGLQTSLLSGIESSFGMYTFDIGGYVGINTYRRRLFERDFVHIQLLFTSETVNDCAVNELDIEYAVSKKNIGVG